MAASRTAPYATETDQAVYQPRQTNAKAPWEKEAASKPTGRMSQRADQRVKLPPYATSMDTAPVAKSGPANEGAGAAGGSRPSNTMPPPAAEKTGAPWERDENRFRARIGKVPGTWSNLAPYATDGSSAAKAQSSTPAASGSAL